VNVRESRRCRSLKRSRRSTTGAAVVRSGLAAHCSSPRSVLGTPTAGRRLTTLEQAPYLARDSDVAARSSSFALRAAGMGAGPRSVAHRFSPAQPTRRRRIDNTEHAGSKVRRRPTSIRNLPAPRAARSRRSSSARAALGRSPKPHFSSAVLRAQVRTGCGARVWSRGRCARSSCARAEVSSARRGQVPGWGTSMTWSCSMVAKSSGLRVYSGRTLETATAAIIAS
jgi:hypothetical protein